MGKRRWIGGEAESLRERLGITNEGRAGEHIDGGARQQAKPDCGRCWPTPTAPRQVRDAATWDAAKGAGGRMEALNGARRLLVVLELVVDLQPVPLCVRHN
jgi:hypothetical protein